MSNYPVSPAEVTGTVPEDAPDTVATPEGDNEYTPDQPLPGGAAMPTPERPRGNEPQANPEIRPAQGS